MAEPPPGGRIDSATSGPVGEPNLGVSGSNQGETPPADASRANAATDPLHRSGTSDQGYYRSQIAPGAPLSRPEEPRETWADVMEHVRTASPDRLTERIRTRIGSHPWLFFSASLALGLVLTLAYRRRG